MTRPTVLVALTVVLLAMAGDRWDLARAQDQEAEPFISEFISAESMTISAQVLPETQPLSPSG